MRTPKTIKQTIALLAGVILSVISASSPLAAQDLPSVTPQFEYLRNKKTNKIIWGQRVKASPKLKAQSLVNESSQSAKKSVATATPSPSPSPTLAPNYALNSAKQFVSRYSRAFSIRKEDTGLNQVSTDKLGMTHVRFGQRYRGIPVYGADVMLHVDKFGVVQTVGGNTSVIRFLSPRKQIQKQEAVGYAIQMWRETVNDPIAVPTLSGARIYVLVPGLLRNNTDTTSYLVWKIDLTSDRGNGNWSFFVDAGSGVERLRISMEQGLDRLISDCSFDPGSDACWAGKDNPNDPWDYMYGRKEGMPASGANPRYLPMISMDTDEAYSLIGEIHQFVKDEYGIDGANGLGGIGNSDKYPAPRTRVQTYSDFVSGNKGACPTGNFLTTGTINVCQGIVVPDIMAHEYSHALIFFAHRDEFDKPVGLVYAGETAALNENHSDAIGEYFEYKRSGTNETTRHNDWIMGEYSTALNKRSFMSPPQGESVFLPIPDRFNSTDFYCGSDDYLFRYSNMQIFNKAFYIVSEGDYFNGCTVTGIGIEKAAKIWSRAALSYYSYSETFNGAYYKLQSACNDLFGQSSSECNSLSRALQAIELDQAGKCSGQHATLPECLDFLG